jgi:putative hydrolase of the HAD superfamily
MEETEEAATEEGDNLVAKLAWSGFNAKILHKLGFEGDCEKIGEALHNESWDNPKNYTLAEDVLPIVKSLKEVGIKVGCISNEDKELNNFFSHFGIKDYFDCLVISEVVGYEKPGKKIFEFGLEQLQAQPDEAIYVGDSVLSDYRGSKNAGLTPVLIDRENKINDNTITKISNLSELNKIIEGENIHACTTA